MDFRRFFLLITCTLGLHFGFELGAQNADNQNSNIFQAWQTATDKTYNKILNSDEAFVLSQKDKNIFFDIISKRNKNNIGHRIDSAFKSNSLYCIFIIEEISSMEYKLRLEERYFSIGINLPEVYFNDKLSSHAYLDIDGWPHRSIRSVEKHCNKTSDLDYLIPYKFVGGKVISWDSERYFPERYLNFDTYKPNEYRVETMIKKLPNGESDVSVNFILPSNNEQSTVVIDISQD